MLGGLVTFRTCQLALGSVRSPTTASRSFPWLSSTGHQTVASWLHVQAQWPSRTQPTQPATAPCTATSDSFWKICFCSWSSHAGIGSAQPQRQQSGCEVSKEMQIIASHLYFTPQSNTSQCSACLLHQAWWCLGRHPWPLSFQSSGKNVPPHAECCLLFITAFIDFCLSALSARVISWLTNRRVKFMLGSLYGAAMKKKKKMASNS